MFLGQPQALNSFSIPSHHAALKAPLTSRLANAITSTAARPSLTKYLTAMATSMVPFCGVKPY